MDKIYLKDNYIVTEIGGIIAVFPKNYSGYSENASGFYINSTFPVNNQRTIFIAFSDIGSIYDEAGVTAYTTDTLRTFLLSYTGFKSPSGGSGGVWGSITGTLSNQTDLQTALNAKQNTLVSGTNVKTIKGQSILGSGNIDLTKSDVGLSNVDNTSDLNKPISTATQTALNAKQDSLVSGTNIKTINSTTLLGSGDVAVQPTLVSGTNIKTINGTSLLGSGDITVGDGITVGTTAVTSGTDGRVFFQAGGVVQQDSAFFWDNTNKRLGIGATPSTSVRLDVRAQGALSTDIAFRVRNSANTFNLIENRGDGNILQLINSTTAFTLQKGFNIGATNDNSIFQAYMTNSSGSNRAGFYAQTAGAGYSHFFHDYGSSGGGGSGSGNLFHNTGAASSYFNFASIGSNSNGFRFIKNTNSTINNTEGRLFQIASSSVTWYQSVISIGTYCGASQSSTPVAAYGGNTFFIANGTAPTTTGTDSFCLYSADIIAGNAAPHFRTENGSIIKLFRGAALTASDGTLANAVTRIAELEARLQAAGLIA